MLSIRRALLQTTMLFGVAGGMHLAANTALAADMSPAPFYTPPVLPQPAVDGFNAKWEALGGSVSGHSWYGSRGAFTIPLGYQGGLQIDAGTGSLSGSGWGMAAAHLFARAPAAGLIGLYASYTQWNKFSGVHVTQIAGEAEVYLGRWTVQGIAGVESGNTASTISTANFALISPGNAPSFAVLNTGIQGYEVRNRFFDQVNLKYYVTDNFAGYVGHRYLGGQNALALGAETALPLGRVMASAFVEGRLGEHAANGVWGGLKFYFGQKDKTLIQRHRQDDPTIWDTLFSFRQFNTGSSTSSQFCTNGNTPFNGSCESF
jgi:hypothetical protein